MRTAAVLGHRARLEALPGSGTGLDQATNDGLSAEPFIAGLQSNVAREAASPGLDFRRRSPYAGSSPPCSLYPRPDKELP